MKVLVTGAGGQVANALSRSAPKSLNVMAVTRAELDVTDATAVERYVARTMPDVIINAAAYTKVDQAEREPDLAQAVNKQGAKNLAASARENGARLIQISTDFVFDGARKSPYGPDATPAPLSTYGMTKLAGEHAVLTELPSNSIVLRTAWVYSASGSNFLVAMLRQLRTHGRAGVVDDQTGTPTSAASVATAIWRFIARPELKGIWHWTDAGSATWYEFAVAIAEEGARVGLLPYKVTVEPTTSAEFSALAQRPKYSVLETKATIGALGLQPRHWRDSLNEVMRELASG